MGDFLSADYWNKRYKQGETGWDLGNISTPIKEYIDQLNDSSIKILIPGCGNAYEGEYMFKKGFKNVHLLDFADESIESFKERVPEFPLDQLYVDDFFHHQGKYDLIIEQTLFCAIDPSLRADYSKKCSTLLRKGGKLVGLMFNRQFEGGPPFGGSIQEYVKYFEPYFTIKTMEPCYKSIAPRSGSEVFVIMIKK